MRLITVKLYYRPGTAERVRQVTLNPAKAQLSERVDFMLPPDRFDYEYEVSWRLNDGRTLTSPRQAGSEATLFVDSVPTS